MSEDETQPLRDQLVKCLRSNGSLKTEAVAQAFRRVPRHLFVPGQPLDQVYSDRAFLTRRRGGVATSSSSQPAIMAVMLEQLQVEPGMRVLEIGAGTGYNAALLAELVREKGRVVTIDIQVDVAEEAHRHLGRAGYPQVEIIAADGAFGYEAAAPFDRIIVTAGCWHVPPAWHQQLTEGGILVLPLRLNLSHLSVALRKRGEQLESLSCAICGFMALQGAFGRSYIRNLRTESGPWLLYDYRGPRLRSSELIRLLDTPPRRLPLKGIKEVAPRHLGFAYFMALQGLPIVAMGSVHQALGAQPGLVWGVVDTSRPSACFISQQDAQKSRCVVYGGDFAFEALRECLQRWRELGKPEAAQIRLRAEPAGCRRLPELPHPASAKGDGLYRFRRRHLLFTAHYEPQEV